MNREDNLSLSHLSARDLTAEEVNAVHGGIRTLTLCTADPPDGDPGECGGH